MFRKVMTVFESYKCYFRQRISSLFILLTVVAATAQAQFAEIEPQHYFRKTVPAGNYSGLAWLGGDGSSLLGRNAYIVVNDKPKADGFDIFTIDINSGTGEITDVKKIRSVVSDYHGLCDGEGIAYFPSARTVFISGEADNRILEYDLQGRLTGRELRLPVTLPQGNYGLESLTYNKVTHRFWTTTESTLPQDGQQANAVNGVRNRLRLMSFDDSLRYRGYLDYIMEGPISTKNATLYAMGVSALCALDNGKLLVLEREAWVPKAKIGAWVVNSVYSVDTRDTSRPVAKHIVAMWRTSMNLVHKDFANYEGMCLGPKLADGRQVIVLCADSQNQSGKLLRDWFRTIVIN